MRHRKRGLKWIVLFVVVLISILPIAIGYLVSSPSPRVQVSAEVVAADHLHRIKQAAEQFRDDLLSAVPEATVTIAGEDVNGLMAFAIRRFPRLSGRTNISRFGLESALSIHLPENPFGDYINLSFGIPPTSSGLVLSHVTIGDLSLSGETALTISRFVLNLILGDDLGTSVIESIQSINVDSKRITLRYRPIPNLKSRFKAFKTRAKVVRDDLALVVDPGVVGIYYESLCQMGNTLQGIPNVSFAAYLTKAFTLAAKRAAVGYDPVAENRSALMALAIYLGSYRFDSFVGVSRTGVLGKCRDQRPVAELAGRKDLRLHFIYSAGLQILSDSVLSFTIGELKEMLDSVRGGSGFSFADLAADKAGIRFAELAVESPRSAQRLHTLAKSLDKESQFFPSITGLPEGITQERFEKELGGIKGEYYANYLAQIMSQIADLPLYNDLASNKLKEPVL